MQIKLCFANAAAFVLLYLRIGINYLQRDAVGNTRFGVLFGTIRYYSVVLAEFFGINW